MTVRSIVTDRGQSKPTFIGIGGMRCGTTWVSECLRYHPEVFMSVPKEIHYFGYKTNWDKGPEWYLAHFKDSKPFKAVGEFSVSYLNNPLAPEQIINTIGNVKIVAVLRNPVARFLSHYKYLIRGGALPKAEYNSLTMDNFRRATDRFPRLLMYGIYCDGLQLFLDAFGKENVYVLLHDEIEENAESALETLYAFLGVNRQYRPPIVNKRVSPGIVPRVSSLEAMRIRLYYALDRRAPWLIVHSRKLRLGEIYRRLNGDKRSGNFKVDDKVIEDLTSYYRDDTIRLGGLLGQDLNSRWIKGEREGISPVENSLAEATVQRK